MEIKKVNKMLKMLVNFSKYFYFKLYCKILNVNNDNVWIISERGVDARDNAFHLFKYIRTNYPGIDIRYVIDKNSVDFNKVSQYGRTVQFGSKEHYILFITSKVLISTHDMGYSPDMSLFTRLNNKNILNICGKKIYIQHGINKDVIHVPKCDLTITGGYPEYIETINSYPDLQNKIKYTGLARFDNLPTHKEKNNRKILFMPTFRKWLVYTNDVEFKKSTYYIKIQELLNNDQFIQILNDNNYELIFYPHIEMQNRINLFSSISSKIKIASFDNYDVQELLIDSDILITDFSSVFFDYAYMNKPVVYYQFDQEEYRSKHYHEGYFSYEKNGFGDVVKDMNHLIKSISNIMENDSQMSLKYLKRKQAYFKLDDNNNCKRIFEEITKIL